MKKQLLLVPLVGLLCFTSCNQSREQKPVDDVTGLTRAKQILSKEVEALEGLANNDPTKLFEILPHKISFKSKTIINGKTRLVIPQIFPISIEENVYNNFVAYERNLEINYDTLQFHTYLYREGAMGTTNEGNFFYDEANSMCYLLEFKIGGKTKHSIPVSDRQAAVVEFAKALNTSAIDYITCLLPVDYLESITQPGSDEDKYDLLETYDDVKEYIDLYGNGGERFNHQFGSDGENSFSLRQDFKIPLHIIPAQGTGYYIGEGWGEGVKSSEYIPEIAILNDYKLSYDFGAPDLVTFENNYLTYATSDRKIDVKSLPQLGLPDNAFYQHTKQNSTFEVNKDQTDITNPNPSDYPEAQ